MNQEQLIGAILGAIGILLIALTLGAWPTIGIVLAIWGNNLEQRGRRSRQRWEL